MEKLYNNPNGADGCAVAIGTFDGFHTGHMKLIDAICDFAKDNNVPSCVFTFSSGPSGQPRVIGDSERDVILSGRGIDILSIHDFTDSFKAMLPQEFFDKYLSRAAFIAVGFNFFFGKNREGNGEYLLQKCKELHIPIEIIPEVKYNETTVSSTAVRNAIANTDFALAEALLGRKYYFSGEVTTGDKIGHQLGFPTANMEIPKGFAMPPKGVYATETKVNDKMYKSVTNIGGKPTIRDNVNRIETHIIGFDGDLYGEKIAVRFIKKIRETMKFSDKKELELQLERDVKSIIEGE